MYYPAMMAELAGPPSDTLWDSVGLRELRQAKVLSQRDLARLSGLSQKTIVHVEAGKKRPHPTTIRKLAAALKMQPEELAAQLLEGERGG